MIKRGLILFIFVVITFERSTEDNNWMDFEKDFEMFSFKFKKNYDPTLREKRLKTFIKNIKSLKNKKKPNYTFTMDINKFADLSWSEFEENYLMHVDIEKEFEEFKSLNPHDFKFMTDFDFGPHGKQKKMNEKFFGGKLFNKNHKKRFSHHHRNLQIEIRNRDFDDDDEDDDEDDSRKPKYAPNRYQISNTPNTYQTQKPSNNYKPSTYQTRYNPTPYQNTHNNSYPRLKEENTQKGPKIDPSLNDYPRKKSWMTSSSPVKNQSKCAACYAFAAISGIELQMRKLGISDEPLSEQEIIDCSTENNNCIGGSPFQVFNYINNNGISFSDEYGYIAKKNPQCLKKRTKKRFQRRISFYFIRNPVELIVALNQGPCVILQHVNQNFKKYSSGIFNDDTCNGTINHAALAVGYDLTGPIPHIICKNGWGDGWGEGGYYKIALGDVTLTSKGTCNMFTHDSNVVPIIY